jgi:hypothetical protein
VKRGDLIVGRYELLTRLGKGGMGEVWTCRDRELRREVAVKLLPLDDAFSPELQRRFEREAVAAAQINHPNVVALYDRGVDDDRLFLVMERVDGTPLATHIRADSLPVVGRALEIAQEICAALVAAHRAKVVHYDIKPLNVMLNSDGRVKVVDFGIAGFVQTAGLTQTQSTELPTAGTPEYGAPEQFLADRGDQRSDLYALGGVLFALLTGGPPFTGPNGFAVVRRKLEEDAPPLLSIRPDLPPAVAQLVDEMLRRDPDQRPQTAAEVHERLAQLRTALDTLDLSGAKTVKIAMAGTDIEPPTRRLGDEPFEITWTGRERLLLKGPGPGKVFWICWTSALIAAIAGVLAVPLIFDTYQSGYVELLLDLDADWHPAKIVLRCSIVGLLIVSGIGIGPVAAAVRLRRVSPWSLRIDRTGIFTTDVAGATVASGPSGRRRFPWDHVSLVTLDRIRTGAGDGRPGLHVRFAEDDPYSARGHPAGWSQHGPAAVRDDGSVPLSVLGPLTEQQHAELTAALTRYAGPRWQPEIGL